MGSHLQHMVFVNPIHHRCLGYLLLPWRSSIVLSISNVKTAFGHNYRPSMRNNHSHNDNMRCTAAAYNVDSWWSSWTICNLSLGTGLLYLHGIRRGIYSVSAGTSDDSFGQTSYKTQAARELVLSTIKAYTYCMSNVLWHATVYDDVDEELMMCVWDILLHTHTHTTDANATQHNMLPAA